MQILKIQQVREKIMKDGSDKKKKKKTCEYMLPETTGTFKFLQKAWSNQLRQEDLARKTDWRRKLESYCCLLRH